MMDAQRLQKLILSLMHDSSFRSRLQNQSCEFLKRFGCTAEEIAHVLSFDARLYEADALRADRILTALLDIFPISVWSALKPDLFPTLRMFFRTNGFHTVLWDGGYVFEQFGTYLADRVGADTSFVKLENAIESVRCTRSSSEAIDQPTHYVLHPQVRIVTLAIGRFDAYVAAREVIQRSEMTGAEFLLRVDDVLPTQTRDDPEEYILVEAADEPQIGAISGSLARTLNFLETARRHDQLAQKLIEEGASADECDDLIADFLESGWIRGQVFTP